MMLEACTTCGEATERGTCVECRQTDRSRHKTARAQAILGVNSPPPAGIPHEPAGTEWIDHAYQSQRKD